jgi:hypothetical protein
LKGHYPLLGIISSRKRGFCLAPHTFTWGLSLAKLGGLTLLFVQGMHKKEISMHVEATEARCRAESDERHHNVLISDFLSVNRQQR